MPISALVAAHRKVVIGLEDDAYQRLLGIYETARDELVGKLRALDERGRGETFTAQHYALMLVQVNDVLEASRQGQIPALRDTTVAGVDLGSRQGVLEVADLERRFGDSDLAERVGAIQPVIPAEQVALLADPQNLLITHFRDGVQAGVNEQLALAVTSGESIAKAARRLVGVIDGERWQLERIARTEINNAANYGHWSTIGQVAREFPEMGLKQQWSAASDERTCPVCGALDGVVIEVGAEFQHTTPPADENDSPKVWRGLHPPAHPNCLPGDARVAAEGVSAAFKRWYDGDLVVIRTASGKELSCTPNHPVLTPGGWVAAGLLHEGGHVISSGGREWEALGDLYDQDVPPRIEDVAEAFGRSEQVSAAPVPVAPEDFHGDGRGSDVAVVWADRLLHDALDTTFTEHGHQGMLRGRGVQALLLARAGAGDLLVHAPLHASNGFVGSCHHCGASVRASLGEAEDVGLAATAGLDAGQSEDTPDRVSGAVVLDAERLDGLPGHEAGNDSIVLQLDSAVELAVGGAQPRSLAEGAPRLAALAEELEDESRRDAELAREIIAGSAGPVFQDEIVDLRVVEFSGHVFNLSTATGHYVANGIVTHNCRCRLNAYSERWGGKPGKKPEGAAAGAGPHEEDDMATQLRGAIAGHLAARAAAGPALDHKALTFEVKELRDDGTFDGMAAGIGNIDSYGDVIEAGAFDQTLAEWKASGKAIPVLWQHDPYAPIGAIDPANMWADSAGLHFKGAKLALGVKLADECKRLMNLKVLGGLSIGYTITAKGERQADDAAKGIRRRLTGVKLYEFSPVTWPANDRCAYGEVKGEGGSKDFDAALAVNERQNDVDEKRWSIMRALWDRVGVIAQAEDLTVDQKVAILEGDLVQFSAAFAAWFRMALEAFEAAREAATAGAAGPGEAKALAPVGTLEVLLEAIVHETKAGKVLSGNNRKLVDAAVSALQAVQAADDAAANKPKSGPAPEARPCEAAQLVDQLKAATLVDALRAAM